QQPGELRQWPVQLHLLNPAAGYLNGADLLLAADCSAYACGGFHGRFLRGKALAIACPKLDDGQQIYLQKLVRMIDESRINTLTVLIMEVPCCSGLLQIARAAAAAAGRKVPVKCIVLSLEGEVLQENWL
ncbi:MAG: 4Fe-4S ferredoxin, partial [Spirochaeta sp.]